jgi:fatty acid desaturase
MVNDVLGELVLGSALFISMRKYRYNHIRHHHFLNSDQDPDLVRKVSCREWTFPQSRRLLIATLCKDLVMLNTSTLVLRIWRFAKQDQHEPSRRSRGCGLGHIRVLLYLTLVVGLTWGGLWKMFLLFWLVPLLTWLNVVLRIRSIAEHCGIAAADPFFRTRTTIASTIERLLVAPRHINYHTEHHLYPSVPFFNLPQLHRELMNVARYRTAATINRGYVSVLREVTTRAQNEKDGCA